MIKKLTSLFLLFFISIIGKAQETDTSALSNKNRGLTSWITLSYEQKYLLSDFQHQLKTTNKVNFSQPCDFISLGYMEELAVGPLTKGEYMFPFVGMFSYLVPSTIIINDSIKEKLRGYNLTVALAGQPIIKRKHIAILVSEGFKTGRLKLIDAEQKKMKNGLFAPYAGLFLRTSISYFTLWTSAQFAYDLSASRWKHTWLSKVQDRSVDGLKQSGLSFSVGISYCFEKNYYHNEKN